MELEEKCTITIEIPRVPDSDDAFTNFNVALMDFYEKVVDDAFAFLDGWELNGMVGIDFAEPDSDSTSEIEGPPTEPLACEADSASTERTVSCWEDKDGRFTCLLPDEHDGPHEWTPDSEITVIFSSQEDS